MKKILALICLILLCGCQDKNVVNNQISTIQEESTQVIQTTQEETVSDVPTTTINYTWTKLQ